jgi:aryl carrier-like protein
LADGRVWFGGRIDRQVKLAGVRVELDAIEAAVRGAPDVADCAVVTVEGPGGREAHAYVTGADANRLAALRAYLHTVLPRSHWPTQIHVVAALPRTAGGKLDRTALVPVHALPSVSPQPVTPADTVAEQIWRKVLGQRTLDPDANFFDLGGSSLRMMDVQIQLRERLGRDIPIVELFRYPTLRTLSGYLAGAVQSETKDGAAIARAAGVLRLAGRRQALESRR